MSLDGLPGFIFKPRLQNSEELSDRFCLSYLDISSSYSTLESKKCDENFWQKSNIRPSFCIEVCFLRR